MSPRKSSRVPLFELSMLIILVVLGWAAVELYRIYVNYQGTQVRWEQHLRQVDQSWKRYVLDVRNLYMMVFNAHHTIRLRETYFSLSGQLQTDLLEMHHVLTNSVPNRDVPAVDRFERQSKELREWLRQYALRVDSEMLLGRSIELQKRMASTLSGRPQPVVMADLQHLIREVDHTYTNYLAEAEQIMRFVRLGLEGHPLPDYLAKAERHLNHLLQLAAECRRSGEAIEELSSLPTDEAAALLEFPQRQLVTGTLAVPAPSEDSDELQRVFHTVAGVWVLLVIFSIAAVYRGVVVEPLREKLTESTALMEHQNKLAHFGQLLGSLAHEIRNPLTAINARLYTLQKAVPENTAEHKDALVIRSEINRLDHIVKDYLTLARPAEPRVIPVRAEQIYGELNDLLGPDLSQQGIDLKVEGLTARPFRADPQQIKQVLINLIQNAAEAIGRDGTITLSAHVDGRLRDSNKDAVALEVEDTGPGIPRDVQEKLFDPFFSTKENGTGLGLAIAAHIVEKHGGKVLFESREGKGTTFRILLPVSETE